MIVLYIPFSLDGWYFVDRVLVCINRQRRDNPCRYRCWRRAKTTTGVISAGP